MSLITALTTQNTLVVQGVLNADFEFLGQQMDSIFEDIITDAVKIGMVSNKEIIITFNGALKANLNFGKGRGPLNHCWNL